MGEVAMEKQSLNLATGFKEGVGRANLQLWVQGVGLEVQVADFLEV
jgi:hypothetical protein